MIPSTKHYSTSMNIRFVLGLIAVLLLLSGCSSKASDQSKQKAFADPDSAVKALLTAVKADNMPELTAIFGPDGAEVLSSGDPVSDKQNREVFLVALEQQWTLDDKSADAKELVIGYDQWPFPIPLVKESRGWRFDTAAGKQEVLARRIGRNELAAIGTCRTYVIAQKEYASESRDGKPAGIYAQKVRSDEGKQNGLYWARKTSDAKPSPLGDLAAQAESEGYDIAHKDKIRPFHGYYFRILTQQGKHATGGAKNYILDGEMKQGFAMIAYPADYGSSGIMTFIVNQDGAIYETDLGEDTLKTASEIKEFNPDDQWRLVE